MILVSVGASQFPFDRLLEAVGGIVTAEPIVVQHGVSGVRPANATNVAFMSLDTLTDHVRRARVIVTHAGVGSILLALANGRSPYVVPRLKAYGETVDDHQLECARRFARAGLVTAVEEPAALGAALGMEASPAPAPSHGPRLVDEIAAYLTATVHSSGARPVRTPS